MPNITKYFKNNILFIPYIYKMLITYTEQIIHICCEPLMCIFNLWSMILNMAQNLYNNKNARLAPKLFVISWTHRTQKCMVPKIFKTFPQDYICPQTNVYFPYTCKIIP